MLTNNINKKKFFIVAIYLIHLIFYTTISYLMINEMLTLEMALQKFDTNRPIINYNHTYISIYYIVLSTYFMVKTLNCNIYKIARILIYGFSLIIFFIALYKYYKVYNFVQMTIVFNGLLISLNYIYKHKKFSNNNLK